MSKKKNILLTGASGLIGSHAVPMLGNIGDVICCGRTACQTKKGSISEFINVDLGRDWNIRSLPGHADIVIHLAQSGNYRDFPTLAMDVFSVNLVTTQKLLDYAVNVEARQFILASSGGVYGYGDQAFNENAMIQTRGNLGYYLGTKLCMEVLAENYSDYIDIIILRFFFVYGPAQKQTMLIPRLVNSVRKGYPIKLQGMDGIRINPTNAETAAGALVSSLKLEGSHKINIAGPEILSLREIGEIIGKTVGKKPIFDIDYETAPNNLIGDTRKMDLLLKIPQISFVDGVQSLI